MRDGEKSAGAAAAARDTADVDAREGMFKVGRDGDPLDGFAGELFSQDAPQLLAEIFARQLTSAADKLDADNFHAFRFYAPKSLHRQSHAAVGLVRDGSTRR